MASSSSGGPAEENSPYEKESFVSTYKGGTEGKFLAVCLSGGGFRAMLFHLGSLRRLYQIGVLQRADVITSVSGGSLMAGILVKALIDHPDLLTGEPNLITWDLLVTKPTLDLASVSFEPGHTASIISPQNLFFLGWRATDLHHFTHFKDHLTKTFCHDGTRHDKPKGSPILFSDLPPKPRFVFVTTCEEIKGPFYFTKGHMWGISATLSEAIAGGGLHVEGNRCTVAEVAAFSSCHPGIFLPQPFDIEEKCFGRPPSFAFARQRLKEGPQPSASELKTLLWDNKIHLFDGGMRDNFGLKVVLREYDHILVSDGSSPSRWYTNDSHGRFVRELYDAATNEGNMIRLKELMEPDEGWKNNAYWAFNIVTRIPSTDGMTYYDCHEREDIAAKAGLGLSKIDPKLAKQLMRCGYMTCSAVLDWSYKDGMPQAFQMNKDPKNPKYPLASNF